MSKATSNKKRGQDSPADPFLAISRDQLEDWAGSAVFNRGLTYQRQRCVRSLQRTEQGEIVAWVEGTRRYAVLLDAANAGKLGSACTCPYADRCKHAVAALLEYQRMLRDGETVSTADATDPRFAALDAALEQGTDGWDDDSHEEDAYEEDEIDADISPSSIRARPPRGSAGNDLIPWLDDLTKKELIELVRDVLRRHPDMLPGFEHAHAMKHLPRSSAVKSMEREIDRVTAEQAWWDGWHHTGHIPDYSGIRSGLSALLKQGHADDIVRLGDRMLPLMTTQIESSNDDGMLGMEMSGALECVFAALKASSLTPIEKMLKAHEWENDDDYGLCDGLETFWSQRFPKKTWSEFADILLSRLDAVSPEDDDFDGFPRYQRDRLGGEIIAALEMAGRDAEALALCEREAPLTLNYGRLVARLVARKRFDDAEKRIREGVAATHETAPGIASDLRARLRDIRATRSDWLFVAALDAEDFFASPDIRSWKAMSTSCEKAGVWPKVRSQAIVFLNTGSSVRPGDTAWPLPKTDLPARRGRIHVPVPDYALLLEIALSEDDRTEVMRLYKKYTASAMRSASRQYLSDDLRDRVAIALESSHPDVSVSIWNGIALEHIAMTNAHDYDCAVKHLKKSKRLLLSLKRDQEWSGFYKALLQQEKRKRRFIQIAHAGLGALS